MKILLSAYSCEPGVGSERGVGWNVAYQAARYHEVWVLTRPDESKTAIEAQLAREPIPNLHFVYFTLPVLGGLWKRGSSGAMQIHYYLWQIQAYFVARKLHRKIEFDVIHHVTFVKYASPSFLSLLDAPFLWGPVGGGESAPQPFWQDFDLRSRLYEYAREAVRWLGERDPFVSLTARHSAAIQATTPDTVERIHRLGAMDVNIAPESGMAIAEIEQLEQCPLPAASPIRFISLGRLLHWKGFHLGLRAFAAANIPNAEYWVVGDGPEEHRLMALVEELGIGSQVKFCGRIPREEVLIKLGQASVLVHPSLHDSGGWVCLEAMAAGRPVICLDLGGPSVQITSKTGFKVPATIPAESVLGIAEAMTKLYVTANLLVEMGTAGRARVREGYSWNVKGDRLNDLYTQIAISPEIESTEASTNPA